MILSIVYVLGIIITFGFFSQDGVAITPKIVVALIWPIFLVFCLGVFMRLILEKNS